MWFEWLWNPHATRRQLDSVAARIDAVAREQRGDGPGTLERRLEASIRTRLRDGDFPPGERLFVRVSGATTMADTLLVRQGSTVSIPNLGEMQLHGLLRSELQDAVTGHVAKYLRDATVRAEPMVRLIVSGFVSSPGVYWFPGDVQLGDVIMRAGGPGMSGDIAKSTVRRRNAQVYSREQVVVFLNEGWTIGRMDLRPGDEIVVGSKRVARDWAQVTQVSVGIAMTIFGAIVYGTRR